MIKITAATAIDPVTKKLSIRTLYVKKKPRAGEVFDAREVDGSWRKFQCIHVIEVPGQRGGFFCLPLARKDDESGKVVVAGLHQLEDGN